MRTATWLDEVREVKAKLAGIGWPPASDPDATAPPLPPANTPASPVVRAWICVL